MQEWTAFIGKTTMPKRGSKWEQNHYGVVTVKRIAGCTENDSWPRANWKHVYLGQESGNIKCTVTGARHYSSDSP